MGPDVPSELSSSPSRACDVSGRKKDDREALPAKRFSPMGEEGHDPRGEQRAAVSEGRLCPFGVDGKAQT